MVLVQNWSFFQLFWGGQNKAEICFLRYWTKNCLYRVEEQEYLNSKNWRFWKGVSPWYWSKNGHFCLFFFLCRYGPGICLLRYSRTKNVFLDYKNKKFKKSKIWHFSKAINAWFWSKNGHFSNIIFRQYRPGECLLRHSRTKNRLTRLGQQEIQKVDKFTFFQRG